MRDHVWVSMQYSPVIVDQLPDGTLNVSATLTSLEVAEREALMGCWFCHMPLTTEAYGTECDPETAVANNEAKSQKNDREP